MKRSLFKFFMYKELKFCIFFIELSMSMNRDKSSTEQKDNLFSLSEVTLSYYKYKINFVDGSPNFVFEEQLLKNTGLGYPANRVLISETPPPCL